MTLKVGVLTSFTAKPVIEDYLRRELEKSSRELEVEVVSLPVHSISSYDAESLRDLIVQTPRLLDVLSRFDVIIIPGTVKGDVSSIEVLLSKPRVYKGPRSFIQLPRLLEMLIRGLELSKKDALEDYCQVSGLHVGSVAFKLGGLNVYQRGPPVLVASELPVSISLDKLANEAARVSSEGADIIIVGSSLYTSPLELANRVYVVEKTVDKPVLAECPSLAHLMEVLKLRVDGVVVSIEVASTLIDAGDYARDVAVVIGDRDVGALLSIADRLRERGHERIVLDPVLGIPFFDLYHSITRYAELSRHSYPLMFTASNVLSLLPGDTHSANALLAMFALELGASIYHVVDEPGKLYHSTAEAKEALRVATAMLSGSKDVDLESRLFIVKNPTPPSSEEKPRTLDSRESTETPGVSNCCFRIHVNHEEGVLVASIISHDREATIREKDARIIGRLISETCSLNAEHALYLGYELARAELALKLSKMYAQNAPIIKTPWGSEW